MRCFKNIANLIRTKRVAHPSNLSQSELSKLLGYKNGQFISNVERGLCSIPLKMLPKVCEILTIDSHDVKKAMLLDQEATLDFFLASEAKEMSTPREKRPTTSSPVVARGPEART